MHEIRGLLGSIIAIIAPLSILSSGIQDAAGEAAVYVSLAVGGIGLYKVVVRPLQQIAVRSERIPHIEKRITNLEKHVGIDEPLEDPA